MCPSNQSPLSKFMKSNLESDDKILIIGCGSSRMAFDMLEDDFEDITCIDWSQQAIQIQNNYLKEYLGQANSDEDSDDLQQENEKANNSTENVKFIQMDARDLKLIKDASFDCVIDKGLIDVLVSAAPNSADIEQILTEVHRVLTPVGKFICVSVGSTS